MSSASDDEDTTSARPLARPPAPRSATPRTNLPAGSTLAWGLVGSLHRVETLMVIPGQTGVVRLVPNMLSYSKPPIEVSWYPVKAEPGRYEMSWPDDPTAVRTLAAIGADARQHAFSQPLTEDHPVAEELDQAIFSLVKQAEKLKRAGWGVGLLTPGGVMMHPSANGPEAVLVDLGFTWKGDFGDPPWEASPGKPVWLTADDLENPASAVWDRAPVEQQFAQPSGHPFPPDAPGAETRTLARVIAWALTGRPSSTLLSNHHATVWQVLDDALTGQIASPKELLQALQEHRPSSHFYAPPRPIELLPAESAKPSSWRLPLLSVALAILLLALAAWLMWPSPETPPTTPATTVTPPSPSTGSPPTSPPTSTPPLTNDDALKLYEQAKGLVDRLKKFGELASQAKTNARLVPQVEAAREQLFGDWVTECEQEITQSSEAALRGSAGEKLRQLVNQYEKLYQDHPPSSPALRDKERQWLDYYDREAELLGWPR